MGSIKVQIPPPLSAQNKYSFAYKTIKDRLPVIIVKTIDFFHRHRKELHKFGGTVENPSDAEIQQIESDAKKIIAYLTKVRKDVETNKPTELLTKFTDLDPKLEYFNDDVDLWNDSLLANKLTDGSLPRYFDSAWLLVECYLYRKFKDAALSTQHLKTFDFFAEQKQLACFASLQQIKIISDHLLNVVKMTSESASDSHPSERTEFGLFMQMALWANKSDLSISGGSADKINNQKHEALADLRDSLDSLHSNILCDNISEAWFKIQSIKGRVRKLIGENDSNENSKPIYLDLVADNSGYEIFVDLCLVHLISLILCGSQASKSALIFRVHVKRIPWFVSDTLKHDIHWLLRYLTSPEQEPSVRAIGEIWESFISSGHWEIHDHMFWTTPYDYSEMKSKSPDLYATLSDSSFIIFKGDLNYRKLTGDRQWHMLTPFRVALRQFEPAPLVALRTAKADVVVGIEDVNIFARINNNELPRDWMISGDYGMVQFLDPL